MAGNGKNGKKKVVGKPAVKDADVLDHQPAKEAGNIAKGEGKIAEGMNPTCEAFARKFAEVKRKRQAKDPDAFNKLIRKYQAEES